MAENLQPGQHWPKHFEGFYFNFLLGCISFYFNTLLVCVCAWGQTLGIINNIKMKRIQPQSSIQITTQ